MTQIFSNQLTTDAQKAGVLLCVYSPEQVQFIAKALANNSQSVFDSISTLSGKYMSLKSPMHYLKFSDVVDADDVFSIINSFSAITNGAFKGNWNAPEYKNLLEKLGFNTKAAKKAAEEIDTEESLKVTTSIANFLKKLTNKISFGLTNLDTKLPDPDIMYEFIRLGRVIREGLKQASMITSQLTAVTQAPKGLMIEAKPAGDVSDANDYDYGDVPGFKDYKDNYFTGDVAISQSNLDKLVGDVVSAVQGDAPFAEVHGEMTSHFMRPLTAGIFKTLGVNQTSSPAFVKKLLNLTKRFENDRQNWAQMLKVQTDRLEKRKLRSMIRSYDALKSITMAPYLTRLRIGDVSSEDRGDVNETN